MATEQSQEQGSRAGISNVIGLERDSGVGYHFDPMEAMAHMSYDASQWMCLTRMTEREIQIQSLRFARRHRARFGNSRLDLVDYYKALLRVSLNGAGRAEIEAMQKAERNRDADVKSGWGQAFGARPNPERDAMRLNG